MEGYFELAKYRDASRLQTVLLYLKDVAMVADACDDVWKGHVHHSFKKAVRIVS